MSAVGWAPLIDFGFHSKFPPAQQAAQATCHRLDPTYGGHQGDSHARENQYAFAQGRCDSILVLKGIVAKIGIALSMRYFPAAVPAGRRVLQRPAEPINGQLRFTGGRRDVVAWLQPSSWNAARPCFSPTGPARQAP